MMDSDLAAKMAALEKRINTRQAEREARLERKIRNGLRWQIGITLVGIAIAVVLLNNMHGILIQMSIWSRSPHEVSMGETPNGG